jgi:hypothetical protein
MSSGYTTSLPSDVLLDTGVLYTGGGTKVGVTRGGLKFNPNKEMRNIEFDGKRSNIEGLDRIVNHGASIEGTFIQLGLTQVPQFEAGVTTTTPGGNISKLHTPKAASLLFSAGDYINNLRLVYARQGGGFVQVRFPKALVSHYQWSGTDKSEAEVQATFESRLGSTAAASSTDTAPYVIEEIAAIS